MEWTEDQLNAIRDRYWKEREADCPTCERSLVFDDPAASMAGQREFEARCDRCKVGYQITPDADPMASQFRDWNAEEQAILLSESEKQPVYCPGDGSLLDASVEPVGGSIKVGARALVVRCGRCGRACSEPR
jgi:hypothetical protein